jgi:flagellar biogenesis protein FliO
MTIYMQDENSEIAAADTIASAVSEVSSQMPAGDLGAAFAKMIFSLLILVLLLLLTYWFVRKLIQQRLQRGGATAEIQVIEKKMISSKTILYLVEVNKKKILLAESHLELKRLESFDKVDN